ncbi:hypothetical protein GCM10007425_07120 [Lysinibacillus alkalisoli]|uniref:Uncharacterized protein n=1 Tax=Lysinibacillus alkalisoli TaxID=1911548 RepID=A0A917LEA7_9BACI|nr:hypothetical protein [Lysinibacillus alkalisoli]GGG15419.1 hypothetical protein GCM10007425_07120 [Lysinibacillus alkalisoli]
MKIYPITSLGHVSSAKKTTMPSTVFEDFMPKTFFKNPSKQVTTEDDRQKQMKELRMQLQECILLYNLTKDPKILRQIETIQQRLEKLMKTTTTTNVDDANESPQLSPTMKADITDNDRSTTNSFSQNNHT